MARACTLCSLLHKISLCIIFSPDLCCMLYRFSVCINKVICKKLIYAIPSTVKLSFIAICICTIYFIQFVCTRVPYITLYTYCLIIAYKICLTVYSLCFGIGPFRYSGKAVEIKRSVNRLRPCSQIESLRSSSSQSSGIPRIC